MAVLSTLRLTYISEVFQGWQASVSPRALGGSPGVWAQGGCRWWVPQQPRGLRDTVGVLSGVGVFRVGAEGPHTQAGPRGTDQRVGCLSEHGPRRPQGSSSRNNKRRTNQLPRSVNLPQAHEARGAWLSEPRTGGADRCGQVGKPRHREGGGHFPKVSPLARAKAKDRETVGWRGAALGGGRPRTASLLHAPHALGRGPHTGRRR